MSKGWDIRLRRFDIKTVAVAAVLSASLVYGAELTPQIVQAIKNGDAAYVAEHIKSADEANAKNENNKSALMLAVWEGKEDIVKILIGKGADVNATDKNGKNAYMLAVWRENLKLMKYLESKGADKEAKEKDGLAAVDIAHLTGNGEIIDYLDGNSSRKVPVATQPQQP